MTSDCTSHSYAGRPSGYAQITKNGETAEAHRWAWAEANGVKLADIKGRVILHTCDNPRCINPAHLRLGTQADNMQDMVVKGRSLIGTKNSQAKLTESDVRLLRELWKTSLYTTKQLAAKFNCGTTQVNRIVNYQSWANLK